MRSREAGNERVRSWSGLVAGVAIVALLMVPIAAQAQDTTRTPRPDTLRAPADSLRVLGDTLRVEGATHTVKRGDTLWDLAAAYLGDPFLWPEIYRVNQDVVENPHWIYPGEVLRVPGRAQMAAGDEPVADPVTEPARPRGAGPTVFTPAQGVETLRPGIDFADAPLPTVRPGQIVAAPYVDQFDGPRDPGRILDSRELAGIHTESARGRYRQYEEVTITLPGDATGRVGERYVAVARGPVLEGLGQLLVPTGVLELIRSPVDGQAAIARVNGLFDDLRSDHRLVVMRGLEAPTVQAVALPAGTGQEARIRHVVEEHVLPSIGSFLVIDASTRHGMRVGDELLIYEPRREGTAGRPDQPEVPIARAQVVRATPYAATAVVQAVDQPNIERGKWVRVIARMP